MRKLLIIGLVLLLASCSREEILPFPCLDGNCDTNFWIDTNVSPGTYQDENGSWLNPNEVASSNNNNYFVKGHPEKKVKVGDSLILNFDFYLGK